MVSWAIDREKLVRYHSDIGSQGIALYVFLASMADDGHKVKITVRKLAELMDLTPASVRKYMRKLETAKIVAVERNLNEERGLEANTYELLI